MGISTVLAPLKALARVDLLILDDWGLSVLQPAAPRWGRRTIGGRSVLALNGVALAVIFKDCIRVQIPASSSFAPI